MVKNEINYSLWLRPAQTQIDEFTEIISGLAHSYRTAPFPPHITLLSSIPTKLSIIKQICKKIVNQTQEFDIPLQKIDYTEAYYRNFFILADVTQELSKIYEKAKIELAYKTNEDFMPHLSLLYGKLDLKTKNKLKEKLEGTYPKKVNCQRLDIYNSAGNVSDWFLIESYPFIKTKIQNYK